MREETISLGYEPRDWQKTCHESMARFTVLALHRRAGKTELAIMQLIKAAIECKNELALFFYVAPLLKQAKIIAWERLKSRLRPLLICGAAETNEGELFIHFRHNGAKIRLYGGDNPDGMRGVRLDGVVIDEVAQIKPAVWRDILQPALSDRRGWALFIGTPSGVNMFSDLFFKAASLEDWHAALWTVYDTDAILPAEVERLRRDMSETSFSREYLCDFSASGEDQLISLTDCMESAKRCFKKSDIDYAPRILGVDPARFGDDRSVIFPRQGLMAFDPIVYRGIDNMTLAGHVAAKIESWQPDAVFIDAGNGGGVIDRLRQLGHNVIEVNFGGKSSDPHYNNKRTEMWFGVRDWIRAGGGVPESSSLKQDLAAPVFFYDAANRTCLEKKDDIKARGLPSPDEGDALALTFAFPVTKKNGVYNRPQKPYNVMDSINKI